MDSTLFNQWIGSVASSVEFDKDVPRFSYNDMLAFGEFVSNMKSHFIFVTSNEERDNILREYSSRA